MRVQSIVDTIGNTPHVRLQRLFGSAHEVYLKLERANPGGSIKDRIALAMVDEAEAAGILDKETTIIEPTSGNTGIGLAMVAAARGYRLILTMPESMSLERRRLLQAFGATLYLTPREKGMPGAIERAEELCRTITKSWMPQQFNNPANIQCHFDRTATEILDDFPDGIDALITGVGTGGHITGCGRRLKQVWPNLKVYAVEPMKSPVLSGGSPAPHKIQGIGAGFVPQNFDSSICDRVLQVSEEDAFTFAREAARQEGILLGISSGATLAAIHSTLAGLPSGARVLGFCYDTGERYLSVDGLFPTDLTDGSVA